MKLITAAFLSFIILFSAAQAGEPVYDYPINNPYVATIITTPPEIKVDYHDSPKPVERRIVIFPEREIPEGFWYERGLKYGELLQDHPAAIVYVIAGTGADIHAEKMQYLSAILYYAGFHVILLPSPTHQNFIVNASSNFIVGNPRQDAVDLYKAMQMIDLEVKKKVSVTGHLLCGFSLGGLNAAFTAKLDDEQKVLNFSRVLLINPPYNLYTSIKIIDNLLYSAMPQGVNNADTFVKSALMRLSSVSQSGDALDFSNERLLLDAYNKYAPSDARLASTIGLSFRLSAANMVFASDVMSHSGYIFPKNQEFTTSTHLNDYMAVALRTSFQNYFDDIYSDQYLRGRDKSELAAESGLESISEYLHNNPKIGLITNQDDIVLAPGDIEKMGAIFGGNAIIFANGGHGGNLGHPTVAYHIFKFMGGK